MSDIARLCFVAQTLYLYTVKKLSLRGIARKIGASYNAVRNVVLANNITIRPQKRIDSNLSRLITKLYTKEKLSTQKIGKRFGFSSAAIFKHLKKLGVKLREKSDYYTDFDFAGAPKDIIAYLAGALLGDAHISVNHIALEVKSKKFAETVALCLEKIRNYGLTKISLLRAKRNTRYLVLAYGKGFALAMKNYRSWLRNIALAHPADFVRGIYDAEGSFSISIRQIRGCLNVNMSISIECSDIVLINTLTECLNKLGINHCYYHRHRYGKQYYIVQIRRGKHILRFFQIIRPTIRNLEDYFAYKPSRKKQIYLLNKALSHTRNKYRQEILKKILRNP